MSHTTPGEAMPNSVLEASRLFMAAAQRTNTLYELSAEYLGLLDALEQETEDPDRIEAELDRIAGKITHKAEVIVGLVVQLDGMAAMRKAEAARLRERAGADERHAVRLRDYLLRHMQDIGTERIDTARFTIAIRQNPPAVETLDEWEIQVPPMYLKTITTTSVDKRAILEHFKATGEIPPGVEIVRRQRLDVR